MKFRRTPRLLIATIFSLLLIIGIVIAIRFAKGYRPSFSSGKLEGTGLLSANSTPRGASVFINDKLTTATDDTLNLPPGEYLIKIAKDGYISWEKTLILQEQLVTQTNTRLFPAVPDLKPVTFSGATNLTPSPDGQKIAFAVENATTDDKNGLYILELLNPTFSFNSAPRQISRPNTKFDFTTAKLTWSPDSSQILVTVNLDKTNEANVLLSSSNLNDIATLKDVTARLPVILAEWNELLDKKGLDRLAELPEFMQNLATASANTVYWSPDEDKLMYTATKELTIPEELIPPVPASSTQKETRDLKPENIYIYDLEEDKNFLIGTAPEANSNDSPGRPEGIPRGGSDLTELQNRYLPLNLQSIQWYPDSLHFIEVQEDKIIIGEYDGTNRHTIYAGPFAGSFAFPWPNGARLVILASLNGGTNQPPNLYSINLK